MHVCILRLQTAGDIHAARLAAGRWGAELEGGCDRWVDLSALTDDGAAKRILGERVDVLVDLNGQSKGGRPGILLRGPAPGGAEILKQCFKIVLRL